MQTAPTAASVVDLDTASDSVLAQRIAAADTDALCVVMRRYNQQLYRTARSILKDDAEAEDAVQDTYILAYRSIIGFRGDATLSTWLTRIVVNESLGRLRKRKRRAEIIHIDDGAIAVSEDAGHFMEQDPTDQPEAALLRNEVRRLIEHKIDNLPDAFRSVFVLRALEEMTVEETAAALSIPEATVRTRHFRAKGLLREALAREIDFNFENAFGCAGPRCDRIVSNVLQRLKDLPAHAL